VDCAIFSFTVACSFGGLVATPRPSSADFFIFSLFFLKKIFVYRLLSAVAISAKITRLGAMVTGAEVQGFFLCDVDVAACTRGVDVAPSSGQWAPRDSVLFLYFSHSMSSSFADLDFKFVEQKKYPNKVGVFMHGSFSRVL
jgi:hypothetical protein